MAEKFKGTYSKIKSNTSRKKLQHRKSKIKFYWIALIFMVLLFILIFPTFVNYIVLYNGDKLDWLKPKGVVSQNNQWVGFLASYSGSILGGIIGGAMTLIGVRLTIKNKNKEDMINMYPSKRKAIKEFKKRISILNSKLEPLIYMKQSKSSHEYIVEINQVVSEFEQDEKLSQYAGEVNGFLLMLTLDFIELNADIDNELVMSGKINLLSDNQMKDIILNLKLNWDYVIKAVDEECKNLILEMEDIILSK